MVLPDLVDACGLTGTTLIYHKILFSQAGGNTVINSLFNEVD